MLGTLSGNMGVVPSCTYLRGHGAWLVLAGAGIALQEQITQVVLSRGPRGGLSIRHCQADGSSQGKCGRVTLRTAAMQLAE